jgi:hypothetical protein
MKNTSPYISAINDRIWIRNLDANKPDMSLKFFQSLKDSNLWYVPFETQTDLPSVLMKLRDKGLAFLEEPAGWPPATIFEKLRKDGKVNGNYLTITFTGNGNYEIKEAK